MLAGRRQPRLTGAALVAALAAIASCRQIVGLDEGSSCGVDPLMIDDMEDGVADICNVDGRHGEWFTASDGTSASLTPAAGQMFKPTLIPGGRGASRYAAHMTGGGFS